jgi:hypothetical protein
LPEKPYLLGGVGIISGYIFARIRGEKRIFSEDMVYHLRKKQKERLISILRKVVFS